MCWEYCEKNVKIKLCDTECVMYGGLSLFNILLIWDSVVFTENLSPYTKELQCITNAGHLMDT